MAGTSEDTAVQPTGAVRSSDANSLDFTSIPLIGLIGVARTAAEGACKYGRHNYMRGFPVHDLLNHTMRHLTMYLLGDRSEPHLEHAAWGVLAAVQASVLNPELNTEHDLGPGATLTPDALDAMAKKEPELATARKRGDFAGSWRLADLPEIQTLLQQRESEVEKTGGQLRRESLVSIPIVRRP